MMRRQRNTMVQTEEQYIFIYRALLDSLSSVNSEMTEAELRVHYGELHHPTSDGTNLDKEFKKLGDVQASNNYRTDSAQLAANKSKNRFQNIMPFEHTRVKLTPLPGVVGSDYLNASLIDGHKQRGAYIATQGPLEETSKDFWRMVWEQESIVIVMLTQLMENGRAKSDQYWPDRDEGSVTFGDYQVSLDMESPTAYGVERMFTVTELVSETTRTVKQCQFTKWPGPNEQQDGVPMVKMCRAVKMYQDSKVVVPQMRESIYGNASAINEQSRLKQTKPIVVHCSAGVGRSGAFCAFHINLKKLEEDNKVDVFSTVKHLRTQRMSMVQTPDQYEYIYRVLLDMMDAGTEQFSDGNNLYENVPTQRLPRPSYSPEDAVAMQELLPEVLPMLPPKLPQRPAAVVAAPGPGPTPRAQPSEEALLASIISPNPAYEGASIEELTGVGMDAPALAAAPAPADFEEAQFSGIDDVDGFDDGPSLPPKSAAASRMMSYEVVADGFSV
jgi:protein tyrosine phosphatase